MNGLFGKLVGAINRDLTPGYVLGDPVPAYDVADVWALHRATARGGGSGGAAGGVGVSAGPGASGGADGGAGAPALALVFDPAARPSASSSSSSSSSAAAAMMMTNAAAGATATARAELARAGLSQIKRLKHPDVLRYVSSAEHPDGTIFVATEPATPLATLLNSGGSAAAAGGGGVSNSVLDRESVQWGLFTIARALGFLHQSGLIHGRLNAATVFVTPSGDWKLGGLETVTPHANAASLSRFVALQPLAYQSPEFANGNWAVVASSAPGAVDSWALGCLMFHAHNRSLTSPDQLRNTTPIPKALLTAYQKLLASNPTARAPAAQIPSHPYFRSSKFVELNMFVENLALKGELEREAFLTKLPSLMDGLPDGFCTFKVLPMLSQSIESGRGAASAFACVVKMKDRLTDHDFQSLVVKGHAARWYSNPALDRAVRVELFSKMDLFVKHLDPSTINSAIFPAMAGAFQDAQAPALRDAAVKSVIGIAPSLNDKNLNTVLMSHFARLQVDPEPAIRTNTTVCLGRLAGRLNQSTRNKVLIPAFLRALKDPFPPARAAGGNAILLTAEFYGVKDVATRILPAVTPLLVDPATDVRNLAFRILSTFQPALDRNHAEMTKAEAASANSTSNGAINMSASSSNQGSTASSGWGLSSLTSMTAALLTTKPDPNAATSRAASGGISSEDFKNGALVRPANPMASASTGSIPNVVGAADVVGLSSTNLHAQSLSAIPAASSLSVSANGNWPPSDDSFGDFHAASEGGNDDNDGDGWGDMNPKGGKTTGANAGGAAQEEDDFLAMLGPPVNQARKAVPNGLSRSGSSASASSGKDSWDIPAPSAVPSGRPPPARKPSTIPSGSSGGLSVGGPTARRTAAKKSGADDWEALLSGDGGGAAPKRKGLGATRR